ncbi:MAG: hypothetical protein AB8G05_14950 [Oligoflexales bacterium]
MHYIVIPILAFFLTNSVYSQPSAREIAPESPKPNKFDRHRELYSSIDELFDAFMKRKINKKMARERYRNCVEKIVNDSSISTEEQKELVLDSFNKVFFPNTQINPDRLTLNKLLEACSIWGDAAYAHFLLHTMQGIWNINPTASQRILLLRLVGDPAK